MSDLNLCPRCGGPLPNNDALGGGCPRCLLELGFDTSVSSRERPTPGVGERPAVIGRYRILRLIGEGGMGAVYEAEQDHPRRTVALKIIKSGMASQELLRRFEQESQALGRLQHPGIAQIYEAGTVDTGFGPQPYFAMELIRGQSPREYAEANHLNARDRLQMMVKICDAVHHAHQRGLIHRDLKPGNILVDETGQPKILDFGVARVTDSDSRATQQTDMGQLIGTLAYMSPEQALADPLDIDTRSDVYSLGVILYELLAGRLPYTISKKVHEAIQAIREEDPARLSTSNRTFRGDIETIVAKALEKERERRYASAAEMAADIQRYLNDEPIIARRPSASYQLQKFARRNKTFVTGVAAVFAVLVVGLAAFAWQAAVAGEERDRALKAEGRANDNEREATQALARETDLRHVAEDLRVQTEAQALVTKQALGAAELNLYFDNIALADREWASSNIAHVDQLLKEAPAALRNWEWHYLARRNHMEDAVIGGHQEAIRDMAIDTDGRHVRTVSINNTVKDWDLETKKEISTESYGTSFPDGIRTRAVSLGANGRILYSTGTKFMNGSYSEIHKFWDLSTNSEVYSLAETTLFLKGVPNTFPKFGPIALSSDGRRLVAGFRNTQTERSRFQLRSWETGTARELPPLGDFTDGIRRLQFSPDGSTLALVQNGSMIMVNSATGQKLVAFEHSQGTKAALAFSPDSTTIVAGIENDVLRGWKTSDGKELWSVSCGNVTHIAFSPNSRSVAIALSDRTIRILNSATGWEEARLTGQLGAISAIGFTSDGTQILSAGDDKVIRVWNLRTPVPDWKLEVGEIPSRMRTSPDGSRLLVATAPGLQSWNRTARLLEFELPPNDRTQDMIFSADGSRIVVFNGNDRLGAAINDFDLQVLDAYTGREIAALHPLRKQNSENDNAVEFGISGSGDRAAIASVLLSPRVGPNGSKISIWEVGTGKLITTLRIEKTQVFSFRFSPNGKVAALQSYVNAGLISKEEIEIYDTTTGSRLQRFDVGQSEENFGPLIFSPDGNRLAEVEQGRNIIIWDPLTGEKLASIPEAGNPGTEVMSLAFNPDGSRLVSVSSDGVPRLWDSKSGKALISLSESSGPYAASEVIVNVKKSGLQSNQSATIEKELSISFTPDGQQIILTTVRPDPAGVNVRTQIWDGTPIQR